MFYDAFTLTRTVRQIPEPVRARLLAAPIRGTRDMADFGQHFDATDVVSGNKSPVFFRLIFSATSPGYCLVYYEHGGIAHSHKVDFFRLSGGQATRLWGADLVGQPVRAWPTDPTTLAQLRTGIRAGRYDTAHRF